MYTRHQFFTEASNDASLEPLGNDLCALAYRSRARAPLEPLALEDLLTQSRNSNREQGLTGLLVFDDGCFFQWLEGPRDAVARTWAAILRDPRHEQIELLGQTRLPLRVFSQHTMQIGQRQDIQAPIIAESVGVPAPLLATLHSQTSLVLAMWQRLGRLESGQQEQIQTLPIDIPVLVQTLMPAVTDPLERINLDDATDVLSDLVARALGSDANAVARLVSALRLHGLSPETIFLDFFEPAARRFGDLWQDDRCSDFDITVALARLQSLTRGLADEFRYPSRTPRTPRSVLIATAPGGSHMLAMDLSTEYFWRAGWKVTCAFPQNDAELARLLHDQRFDALDLSLSSVFRHDHRLARMATSVHAARDASLNSALVVLVSGRIFHERPEYSLMVGADAGCMSAAGAEPLAEKLIAALAMPAFSMVSATLHSVTEQVVAKTFRQKSARTA